MTAQVKPIFLLSDSHILFWRDKNGLILERIRKLVEENEERAEGPIKAAYIGASNDDNPDYYDIFAAAVQQVDIVDRRMLPSEPREEDYDFLDTADIILLAGGDVEKGWTVIDQKFREKIVERYYAGAILIGVSAGAVQLGIKGWPEKEPQTDKLFDTFQLVPAVIDVHNEETDWEWLESMVKHLGGYTRGYGIPMGGGAVYHPDWSFEAIRHHLVEFSHVKEEFKRSLIMPSEEGTPETDGDDYALRGKVVSPDNILESGIQLPPME